jgi:hypothetical protein
MRKIISNLIDKTLFISLISLSFLLLLLLSAIWMGFIEDARTVVMRVSKVELLLILIILPSITASIWMLVEKFNEKN